MYGIDLMIWSFLGSRRSLFALLQFCTQNVSQSPKDFLIFMEFVRAVEWQVGGYCLEPAAQIWSQRVPDSPL